ncbi:MAG: S24 family peptidase [Bacteroidetes bacterium]|nr:MAG: S24 family peptidase [Bacteroidota bacterium]
MGDFSKSIVNQRFRQVYEELEKRGMIKGKSDLGKKLGTYNHVINSILKGERNLTVEQLHKLFETFHVDANFMFGFSEGIFQEGATGLYDFPTRSLSERSFAGRSNITLVPDRALAGYALEHQDETFLSELPKFSIPHLEGSLIAFEISGDSMYPTITNGDIVVCEPLERDDPLRDNNVYVVVTDVVVAKRIQQVKQGDHLAQLRLISDNEMYKPYEVDAQDVRQILRVKCRLTTHAIA